MTRVNRVRPGTLQDYGVHTESGCLIWTGRIDADGYGRLKINGRPRRVHRVALEQKLGRKLLESEAACHTCDTPRCFSEEHLFAGTWVDNRRDAIAKDRQAKGSSVNTAKLNEDSVRVIRASYAAGQSQKWLAALFGIRNTNVSAIVRRETWAWLPDFPVRVVADEAP